MIGRQGERIVLAMFELVSGAIGFYLLWEACHSWYVIGAVFFILWSTLTAIYLQLDKVRIL